MSNKCKKLYLISNKLTGESEVCFLEGLENQFDHQTDWFIMKIISDGRRVYRQEKKIPRELGEKLWEMVSKK